MSAELKTLLSQLQAKIQILEEENLMLSDRAEDLILLGQVAEQVNQLNEPVEIIDTVLERIAIFKDIPYCAYGQIEEHTPRIKQNYALFREQSASSDQLHLPDAIIDELKHGIYLASDEIFVQSGIELKLSSSEFKVNALAIAPFTTQSGPLSFLLIAIDDKDQNRLSGMVMLLQRIIDMTADKLDNIQLVRDLQTLNNELDRKVEERTRELIQSERKYRLLFEKAYEPIFLIDIKTSRYKDANQAAVNLLGRQLSELKEQKISELTESGAEERLQRIAGSTEPLDLGEVTYIRPDGGKRVVQMTSVPLDNTTAYGIAYDITDRKNAESRMKQDLHEKEVLLAEIHHRVKNNLAVICGLLSMQARYIDTKEQALAACATTSERIRSMAAIHNKLYQSGLFTAVDMKDYTYTLVKELSMLYTQNQDITYNFDLEEIQLDIEKAIPSGMIINELVTNSFKHGFKDLERGTLHISFKHHPPNGYRLVVEDDGHGLPVTTPQDSGGMGTQLLRLLTEQLAGNVTIDGSGGTRITIDFPEQI